MTDQVVDVQEVTDPVAEDYEETRKLQRIISELIASRRGVGLPKWLIQTEEGIRAVDLAMQKTAPDIIAEIEEMERQARAAALDALSASGLADLIENLAIKSAADDEAEEDQEDEGEADSTAERDDEVDQADDPSEPAPGVQQAARDRAAEALDV